MDEGQAYEVYFSTIGRLTGHLRIADSAGKIIVAKNLAVDLSGSVQKH
ncbi:hypothetical protein H8E77_23275 [bacterium]|nr:hypothetical protein [bacterium]